LLLNIFPNSPANRAVDCLLAVFPNHTVDSVGNFTCLTFGDVPRERTLACNRNAFNFGTIAGNLLIFEDDLAAILHNDVALGRKRRRARSATRVRARAAIGRLRLFKRKGHDRRDR